MGYISRLRFKLALELLAQEIDTLLEVGYGSGVFLPELSRHCRNLYGLDVHERAHDVKTILARSKTPATLLTGSATAMPFASEMFDCIVSVSALEFVDDISAATRELARVLQPSGRLIVVMPGQSPILDFGLKVLTGKNAHTEYGRRRESLLPALGSSFDVERRILAPAFSLGLGPLYVGVSMKRTT